MQIKEAVKRICIQQLDRTYEKQLAARKVEYHRWVLEKEKEAVSDIAATGEEEFVLLVQKKGQLSNHAGVFLADYFAKVPKTMILYGDEDLLGVDGKRQNPWYKPAWSPDTYLSQFYLGSVIAVRRSFWKAHEPAHILGKWTSQVQEKALGNAVSGEIYVFESAQELRSVVTGLLQAAGGFEKSCQSIQRVPQVLFHASERTVWQGYLSCAEMTSAREEGREITGRCEKASDGKVSVIIPSKDNPKVLAQCLEPLRKLGGLEIIVVDNGSSEENRRQIEQMGVIYIYQPMEFNFSKMCNLGVQKASGDYLLFLNDDVVVQGESWFAGMKQKAAEPYVGAVGLKLYYPDSCKLQHAGITNADVGPVHKLQFATDEVEYYFNRNRGAWNCLAVTGACLMIQKEKYTEAGGFKEQLPVAYNDVELGFSLYEAGYRNVVLLDDFAYHYESLSRGDDVIGEKFERLMREKEKLYELHPQLRYEDPYYPKELDGSGLDSGIVPKYLSAGNRAQQAVPVQCPFTREELREDKCLITGLGQNAKGDITGYGVVLGDDNACYDRYLLFTRDRQKLSEAYVVKTKRQYRQDLEKNIPDQKNVAMSGFEVVLSKEDTILSKEYEIGVIAVHKVSKLKLLSFSGRHLQ